MLVCEAKFFSFLSYFQVGGLNSQLCSQRVQIKHLFQNRQLRPIRAYRHVAILPFLPSSRNGVNADFNADVNADVVITWDDIASLAKDLMGVDHYVTARLRNAIGRIPDPTIPYFDGILEFGPMRKKCEELGNKIQVGYVGGVAALLRMSLSKAEERPWRWRNSENRGRVTRGNWLNGSQWLDIVECRNGFGSKGA